MDPKIRCGALIREAREGLGLSVDAVASQIGVTRSQLYRVEAGSRGCSVPVLIALAEVLSLDLNLLCSNASNRADFPRDVA